LVTHAEATRVRLDKRRIPVGIVILILCSAFFAIGVDFRTVEGAPIDEGFFGSITMVREPVPAIPIDEGLIPVGEAHTFAYWLERDHVYHIYLAGEWADPEVHATDYDVFAYRLAGSEVTLISSHTESAGLLEQVANDEEGRFFTPSASGLYYVTIRNDALESSAAEEGTLMVLEHIEPNTWHDRWMEGKIDEVPQDDTFWSYEFVTSAPRIRIHIDVPDTLDMYEARLYVMGNPDAGSGELVRGAHVAWEPGLKGELSGVYGGFNFDPQGFRHVDAMASCERSGEDMVIDYTAPVAGELLYHLALIGEYGGGKLEFIVQTDFASPQLALVDPPEIVYEGEPVPLEVEIADDTEITAVEFSYTADGGETWSELSPQLTEDGTQFVTVPGAQPGTTVEYIFQAEDTMGNRGEVEGSYFTMGLSTIEIRLVDTELYAGEDAVARGQLYPEGEPIALSYSHGEEQTNFTVATDLTGRFNHTFTPTALGDWHLLAFFPGNEAYESSISEVLNFTVSSLSSSVTFTIDKDEVEAGGRVALAGYISPQRAGTAVELFVWSGEESEKIYARTEEDGSFSAEFEPPVKGTWNIQARTFGDGFTYQDSQSEPRELAVVTPSLTTTITRLPGMIIARAAPYLRPPFIYGIVGVLGVVGGGVFIYLRRRE